MCIAGSKRTVWVWWRMVRFFPLTFFFGPGGQERVHVRMLRIWETGDWWYFWFELSYLTLRPSCLLIWWHWHFSPTQRSIPFEAEPKSLICSFFWNPPPTKVRWNVVCHPLSLFKLIHAKDQAGMAQVNVTLKDAKMPKVHWVSQNSLSQS